MKRKYLCEKHIYIFREEINGAERSVFYNKYYQNDPSVGNSPRIKYKSILCWRQAGDDGDRTKLCSKSTSEAGFYESEGLMSVRSLDINCRSNDS